MLKCLRDILCMGLLLRCLSPCRRGWSLGGFALHLLISYFKTSK